MNTYIKKTIISIFLLGLVGCNAGKNKTNIELMQGMFDQISVKAQDWDPKRGGIPGQMVPPENTIPMNQPYYKFETAEEAEAELMNPYTDLDSPEMISRGEKRYMIYCSMCHGVNGDGKGTVSDKLLMPPPSLLSDKVKAMKDARIYHIMTKGRGLMGSYATQIKDPKDRWAIINHIRGLAASAK